MDIKAKNEISHDELDAKKDNLSARYVVKMGQKYELDIKIPFWRFWQKKQLVTLIDKICYQPNICPKCESEATFHRRMQQLGDVMNVFETEKREDSTILLSIKYDFCLDCHTKFVFEMFIFKK